MYPLVVSVFYALMEGALSQYYVLPVHQNFYQTKYAPEYNNYKPKNYEFEYGISDPTTGDHKSQWEKRENGVVHGMYSLLEPDGITRVVEYTADSLNGFRALVKKIPPYNHYKGVTQLPQYYGFNNKYAPHVPVINQEIEEAAPIKEDNETENVETHENDEVDEDSGYTREDDESDRYEAEDEEENNKYFAPYNSANDDDEDD